MTNRTIRTTPPSTGAVSVHTGRRPMCNPAGLHGYAAVETSRPAIDSARHTLPSPLPDQIGRHFEQRPNVMGLGVCSSRIHGGGA